MRQGWPTVGRGRCAVQALQWFHGTVMIAIDVEEEGDDHYAATPTGDFSYRWR